MRGSRAVLLTLTITAGLVALVGVLRGQYARFLAVHWRNRLETVPDERADALVEAVAQLGEPGIPVLVEALGSERESVAGGAKRVLFGEIRRWEMLRAREYSPKLAILAKALADGVEHFGPTARADAADLASRILRLWTLDDQVVDPPEVIGWCETVLRTTSPQRRLLAEKRRPERFGQGAFGAERPPEESAAGVAEGAKILLEGTAELPGGGLPIEPLGSPRLPPGRSDGPRLADAHLRRPRRLDGGGPPRPPEPDEPALIPERPAVPSDGVGPVDLPLLRPLAPSDQTAGPASETPASRSAAADLESVDTVELMRRLQAPDDRTAARARSELVRRGFTETHLALARRIFDPDPKVRMELARLLTELPGVDAAPWLLELSRDEHPDVRLSAIVLMATTGNPALVEAVEAIARQDPDPRVQRQAERIARERRRGVY